MLLINILDILASARLKEKSIKNIPNSFVILQDKLAWR
jgi:hypothetical protein